MFENQEIWNKKYDSPKRKGEGFERWARERELKLSPWPLTPSPLDERLVAYRKFPESHSHHWPPGSQSSLPFATALILSSLSLVGEQLMADQWKRRKGITDLVYMPVIMVFTSLSAGFNINARLREKWLGSRDRRLVFSFLLFHWSAINCSPTSEREGKVCGRLTVYSRIKLWVQPWVS